jgi:hypothetical protein
MSQPEHLRIDGRVPPLDAGADLVWLLRRGPQHDERDIVRVPAYDRLDTGSGRNELNDGDPLESTLLDVATSPMASTATRAARWHSVKHAM